MSKDTITREELNDVLEQMDLPTDAATIFEARDELPVATVKLTQDAAEALAVVLANVGGNPDSTIRGSLNDTMRQLMDQGFDWVILAEKYAHAGSINFI